MLALTGEINVNVESFRGDLGVVWTAKRHEPGTANGAPVAGMDFALHIVWGMAHPLTSDGPGVLLGVSVIKVSGEKWDVKKNLSSS